jgi:hypothetical protein
MTDILSYTKQELEQLNMGELKLIGKQLSMKNRSKWVLKIKAKVIDDILTRLNNQPTNQQQETTTEPINQNEVVLFKINELNHLLQESEMSEQRKHLLLSNLCENHNYAPLEMKQQPPQPQPVVLVQEPQIIDLNLSRKNNINRSDIDKIMSKPYKTSIETDLIELNIRKCLGLY